MMEHLSTEQISQWVAGERTPQLQKHVAGCAACSGELAELDAALARFREVVHETGGTSIPPWQAPAPRGFWFHWPRMVMAAIALCVMTALPVYWSARVRERAAEAARADSQLLQRVDASISRAVPEPMEPLVNLVTWNDGPANKKKAENQ